MAVPPDVAAREDLDIRLRADASSRGPALLCFATALVWLLAGSALGVLVSLKMHEPDLLTGEAWLTFGRVRAAHLNAMVYGWASLAMLGVSVWLIPRLVHTELRWPRVAAAGGLVWNAGVAIGCGLLLAGRSDGLEWLEMDRLLADPWLVVGGGMVGVPLLATLAAREADYLYVSVWYVIGAFVWFPVIFLVGNWPFAGVESAAANWFYAHNALGLWLTAVGLGAAYYFIPKVLGQAIHSYQLSLLGFWALAFFYALNGMHHLLRRDRGARRAHGGGRALARDAGPARAPGGAEHDRNPDPGAERGDAARRADRRRRRALRAPASGPGPGPRGARRGRNPGRGPRAHGRGGGGHLEAPVGRRRPRPAGGELERSQGAGAAGLGERPGRGPAAPLSAPPGSRGRSSRRSPRAATGGA